MEARLLRQTLVLKNSHKLCERLIFLGLLKIGQIMGQASAPAVEMQVWRGGVCTDHHDRGLPGGARSNCRP